MKKLNKMNKLIAALLVVGVAGAGTAYAAEISSPADIAAALTGKTVEELYQEKADGKTFGEIAAESGQLDEFRLEMMEVKKARIEEKVAAGTMTQERADEILAAIEERQSSCDGSGYLDGGQRLGEGFGLGLGNGEGKGNGEGRGNGGAGNCLND